jgi:orotate phosphoribosyltransferase
MTLIDYLADGYKRHEKPVRLKSGKMSQDYINASFTTHNPAAQFHIAQAIREQIRDLREPIHAIGGPTMGADPIAATYSTFSIFHTPIPWFSVRMAGKEHGTGEWIEGPVKPGMNVVIVDDVITTGGSLLHVVAKCVEFGLRPLQIATLVYRMEGEDLRHFWEELAKIAPGCVGPSSFCTLQAVKNAWEAR